MLVDARSGEADRRQADRPHLPGQRDDRQPGQRHLCAQPRRGRAVRLAFRHPRRLYRRGHPPVAVAEISRDGGVEVGRGHGRFLPVWPAALDRQLRAHVWIYIRVPGLIRHYAVCHVRSVRPASQGGPPLAVRYIRSTHIHRAHIIILYESYSRL